MYRITETYDGPKTRRQYVGKCPTCGKRVTRSQTFTMTVNPFNCSKVTGLSKTWDEVSQDLQVKADAWVPDFTHCQ